MGRATRRAVLGFYLGLATMVRERVGPDVAELVRRMAAHQLSRRSGARLRPVLESMAGTRGALGDVL